MVGFVWHQLRGQAWRTVALLTGILVATTGFVVLTGATRTSQLRVTGTIQRESRAAYDILVRPGGDRTALEERRRLVRPNYLSGLFGGITTAQYETVRSIAGVRVAAPIAMLGYSTYGVPASFDLTGAVDRSRDRQVIRVDRTFVAERGLSGAAGKPSFVYVTKRPLIYPMFDPTDSAPGFAYSDGRRYETPCGVVPREVLPGGRSEPVCQPVLRVQGDERVSVTSELEVWDVKAVRLLPDGRFEQGDVIVGSVGRPARSGRLVIESQVSVPLLLAAVDPAAEDRLVGLNRAVVDGRPLKPSEDVVDERLPNNVNRALPVLVTARPYLDGGVRATYTRLAAVPSSWLPAAEYVAPGLARAPGVPAGTGSADLAAGFRASIGAVTGGEPRYGSLNEITQAGATEYGERPDGALRPRVFPPPPPMPVDRAQVGNGLPRPWLAEDVNFRPWRDVSLAGRGHSNTFRLFKPVGVFDPERLTGFAAGSRLPLETYEPPVLAGADAPSRAALGDRPLQPSGNPGGYLSPPPLLLTSLAAVPKLLDRSTGPQRAAPISAIRVRVSGVNGYDRRSAERVRLVGERITAATGLDVDVTLGSSPAPQAVELPAGSYGRPALRLAENWSELGVASVIVRAVDRKSVVLFVLVLLVCGLFLGNAVAAAVRGRVPDLAVLACLGWPARRIGALILAEVAAVGLLAGVLSVGLAPVLAAVLGVGIGWTRAALAVPVALLLALLAAAGPALRAARTHPAAALHPPVAAARRLGRPRTVAGLALLNLARTPGRTLLAAGALAVGVAALTLVASAAYAFRGAIVGSVLGDTVSLSVRGADAVAATITVLLGAAAVADVLYLNIRDRAAELATLRAVGWSGAALGRLVAYEGVALGLLGAGLGAALGLAGAASLVGGLPLGLVLAAVATGAGGALVTGLAALVPAALLQRQPVAALLAEE